MKLMKKCPKQNVACIYNKIIIFSILVHFSYIFIFKNFSLTIPMIYNICSVVFYASLFPVIRKGLYKLVVFLVHMEVSLFVIVCSLNGAEGTGMEIYLIALASLVYFNPYKYKYTTYIFCVVEVIVYIMLRLYSHLYIVEPYPIIGWNSTLMNIYNVCVGVAIILFGAYFADITTNVTQKRLTDENKVLNKLVNYDHLTGLQSRHLFLKKVKNKGNCENITLCIGDIDDFKIVNDTYGHMCGDYILQSVSEIMKEYFDVSKVDICRWGGEEFVFMFYEKSIDDIYEQVDNLRKKIENHKFTYDDIDISVTMTFGLSKNDGKKIDIKLFEAADKLMYKGKTKGKNIVITK